MCRNSIVSHVPACWFCWCLWSLYKEQLVCKYGIQHNYPWKDVTKLSSRYNWFITMVLGIYPVTYKCTSSSETWELRCCRLLDQKWFGEKRLPFALPAIFILCILVFLPALFLLLYPMKIFQKYLGCCSRRLLALHAFADVLQGCYKNGTNGTRDCRYFAGLYLVFRIVLLAAVSIFGFYDEMVSTVCLFTASLLFLLFRPYKNCSWLNIWDSIAFSLYAFVLCIDNLLHLFPFKL